MVLESIINPKRIERGSVKMFFIGLVYASLSLILVHLFFSNDVALSNFSGMIIVTFCVMFSLPFMYYLIKQEEKEDEKVEGFVGVWRAHSDALYAFMWLFLGFIIAFSFWNIILQDSNLLNAQINTYCVMNSPGEVEACALRYSFDNPVELELTGSVTKEARLFSILESNFYVMIFTLVLSLIFGAGAIFILAWNASVIAVAIGIFTKYNVYQIPLGLGRYMVHGFPEIAAYFVTALAGGIFGVGIIRRRKMKRKLLKISGNVLMLILMALILLAVAAVIEVYFTPMMF